MRTLTDLAENASALARSLEERVSRLEASSSAAGGVDVERLLNELRRLESVLESEKGVHEECVRLRVELTRAKYRIGVLVKSVEELLQQQPQQ
jgi:hypothetical protein